MEQSGIRFALMHDEERVLAHTIRSDVDIVVASPPREALAQTLDALHERNLHPVVINRYDAGGSASAYMATESAEDGLQLDMYYDPKGEGRLGLRTDALLANTVQGARWQTVAPEHQMVYLLRKRHWKGDSQALSSIRNELRSFDDELIETAIDSLAGPSVAGSIRRLLAGDLRSFKAPSRNLLVDQYRRLDRLRNHVGFWTEVIGGGSEPLAKELAQRFNRFLMSRMGPRPAHMPSMPFWFAREVAQVRWKPGLFVSWTSQTPRHLRADLELREPKTVGDLAGNVIAAMEARLGL